jgi:hypothetical protein
MTRESLGAFYLLEHYGQGEKSPGTENLPSMA